MKFDLVHVSLSFAGWDEGVIGMQLGEIARIQVKSDVQHHRWIQLIFFC